MFKSLFSSTPEIKSLQAADVYRLWQQQPADTVFLDVRQPEEWAEGTLPGAERISLGNLPARLGSLDRSKSYICICRSGGRSSQACRLMQQAGFHQLLNFDGGMLSWYRAGYPTTK